MGSGRAVLLVVLLFFSVCASQTGIILCVATCVFVSIAVLIIG